MFGYVLVEGEASRIDERYLLINTLSVLKWFRVILHDFGPLKSV